MLTQGNQLGPVISDHPDIFWGLIASFWVGNVLLDGAQRADDRRGSQDAAGARPLPLPSPALFFIAVGVFSTQNSLFQIGKCWPSA